MRKNDLVVREVAELGFVKEFAVRIGGFLQPARRQVIDDPTPRCFALTFHSIFWKNATGTSRFGIASGDIKTIVSATLVVGRLWEPLAAGHIALHAAYR